MDFSSDTGDSDAMPLAEELSSAHLSSAASVLLVEDDASVRRFLEVTLERAGFSVVAVGDGLQAMREFLLHRFDAVVTDAMLPYISGGEICRFLRSHPQLSATPIVLLSGFDKSAASEAACADVYLAKPVRTEELIACLRRLTRQS